MESLSRRAFWDQATFSNFDEFWTTHINFDITVDFGRWVLEVREAIKLKCLWESNKIVLDSWDLNIKSIFLND